MEKLIQDLKIGDRVEGIFIIHQKKVNFKKDGSKFLRLELGDRTGQITGVVWDDIDLALEIIGDEYFIKASGMVDEYNGRRQIVISSLSRIDPKEVNIQDLFPKSPTDWEELKRRFQELRAMVDNHWLKSLLAAIFDDPEIYEPFTILPAAISKHHNYLYGLLDHTIEVTQLLLQASSVFPNLDRDLLLTGGLVHDIGKVAEYRIERGFEFTELGNLFGHVVIGHNMVRDAITKIEGFPTQITTKLLHMVLSHHGREEWGSPRKPAFPEAYLLHAMDNLSSKIHAIDED